MSTDIPDEEREARRDMWASTTSTLGSIRDKATGVFFQRRPRVTDEQALNLYVQNPYVAKIIDRIVDDGLREPFKITNARKRDGSPAEINMADLHSKLDDLGAFTQVKRACKWSRKDGGALILLPILDDKKPSEPAAPGPKAPLMRIGVSPARRAKPQAQDLGVFSPTYGRVLEYDVTGIATTENGVVKVHHTRAIPVTAIDLCYEDAEKWSYGTESTGWGPSIIERVMDDLARDGSSAQHILSMLYVSSFIYTKLQNWRRDHDTKGGDAKCRKLMETLRRQLDGNGILGLDAEDDIGTIERTLAGLADLADQFRDRLAAAANMPREILYNESPNGLRGGELSGPQAIWFATVRQYQQDTLSPIFDELLAVAFKSWGMDVVTWKIEWPELWTPDDAAESETYKRRAEADTLYLNAGVVDVGELRRERFEVGPSGGLELDEREELPDSGTAAASEDPAPGDLLSVQEAASRMGVPTRTITRMLDVGDLRHWRLRGRRQVSLAELFEKAAAAANPAL